MNRILEEHVFGFLIVFLLFVGLAFERDLAYIYLLMIFGDFFFWIIDKNKRIVTEKTSVNRVKSIITAIVAYLFFLLITSILMKTFQPQIIETQSVITLIASTTPILKGSIILTVICWGIMVPIVETRFFFGRLFEFFADWYQKSIGEHIPLDKFSKLTIILILVLSALFSLFHITSKQAASLPMIITFIFALISCILIVKDKELKSAILFHIITNLIAVFARIGFF